MDEALLILTNVPDEKSGQAIARLLIEARLAACVNLLPGIQSIYQWNGAVEQASEVTLFIKATSGRYPEIEAAIKAVHPYDVPEIIAVPIAAGLPAYLDWIAAETKKEVHV